MAYESVVHGRDESYEEFLLRKVAVAYGGDISKVRAHIIFAWASDHAEFLEQAEATIRHWRHSPKPPGYLKQKVAADIKQMIYEVGNSPSDLDIERMAERILDACRP
jgi:hypothetical protein